MATNYTTNYQLNQWEPTDQVLRTDFNADNAKLEAALVEHAAALSCRGNCQVYLHTYTGTGTSGPLSYTFPHKPMLFMVQGGDSWMCGVRDAVHAHGYNWGSYLFPPLVWGDTSITIGNASFDALQCCNNSNTVYMLLAFLSLDA